MASMMLLKTVLGPQRVAQHSRPLALLRRLPQLLETVYITRATRERIRILASLSDMPPTFTRTWRVAGCMCHAASIYYIPLAGCSQFTKSLDPEMNPVP